MVGGVWILLRPTALIAQNMTNNASLVLIKMYGLALLILGMIVYQVWKHYDQIPQLARMVFLSGMIYHFLIGMIVLSQQTLHVITSLEIGYFHLAIAILMVIALIFEKNQPNKIND
jgi:hypothetical protein